MITKFLLPAAFIIAFIIAASDYRYYSKLHQQHLFNTTSLTEAIEKQVMENMDMTLREHFLGLEIIQGRDNGELGIRGSWSEQVSTPEQQHDTRFDLVIDMKAYIVEGELFLAWPCLRAVENSTEKIRQQLYGHGLAFFIKQTIVGGTIQVALPDAPSEQTRIRYRPRVVTQIKTTMGHTIFTVGIPHSNSVFYPPKGWPGAADDPACQPL